jgi:hypothetical protein
MTTDPYKTGVMLQEEITVNIEDKKQTLQVDGQTI